MNAEHTELLQRLDHCSLDADGAALPFSERLARENQWDLAYARRVVTEYKRFAFLAVAAGHPVTPSDQVDQAWHLHLLYTESYWTDFCRSILRQPLHHGPTKGGQTERNKFVNWYEATLVSYRQFFQQEPPSDIWPDPSIRFSEDIHFTRVSTSRNWVIPKPRLALARLKLVMAQRAVPTLPETFALTQSLAWIIGLTTLLLAGCHLQGTAVILPFDLPGNDFLRFYCAAFVFGAGLAYLWRRNLSQPPPTPSPEAVPPLDAYGAAYLAGGASKTIDAVVATLTHAEAVALGPGGQTLTARAELPADAHALEQIAYQQLAEAARPMTGPKLSQALSGALTLIRQGLEGMGYLYGERRALRALWWPALIALIVPALGTIRIMQGIYRDRPVGYLVLLVILSLVVVAGVFVRRLHRTPSGDQVLAQLRNDYALLRENPLAPTRNALGDTLPLAVGLFGLGVLADTSLASLQNVMHPPRPGGGCGSADASSSDGGSGDGGGGCGGGCGGCGGA